MQYNIDQIESRKLFEGIHARCIHTDQVTIAFVELDAGSVLPEHHHFHEQTTTVLEGRLEFVVDGQSVIVEAGQALVIPPHAKHSAVAHGACKVIDVFSPVREDFKISRF